MGKFPGESISYGNISNNSHNDEGSNFNRLDGNEEDIDIAFDDEEEQQPTTANVGGVIVNNLPPVAILPPLSHRCSSNHFIICCQQQKPQQHKCSQCNQHYHRR